MDQSPQKLSGFVNWHWWRKNKSVLSLGQKVALQTEAKESLQLGYSPPQELGGAISQMFAFPLRVEDSYLKGAGRGLILAKLTC